jgi:hypothetical protein
VIYFTKVLVWEKILDGYRSTVKEATSTKEVATRMVARTS